jgi:hypothetical protein
VYNSKSLCHIVLNMHVPNDSLYEELEYVFSQFPKYHLKVLLGEISARVGR